MVVFLVLVLVVDCIVGCDVAVVGCVVDVVDCLGWDVVVVGCVVVIVGCGGMVADCVGWGKLFFSGHSEPFGS